MVAICGSDACQRKVRSDETRLGMCGQCKILRYCSRTCQKAHWKTIHKRECVSVLRWYDDCELRLVWLRGLVSFFSRRASGNWGLAVRRANNLLKIVAENPENVSPESLHQDTATIHMWLVMCFVEEITPNLRDIETFFLGCRGKPFSLWPPMPLASLATTEDYDMTFEHARQYLFHALHGKVQWQIEEANAVLAKMKEICKVWNVMRLYFVRHAPSSVRATLLNMLNP